MRVARPGRVGRREHRGCHKVADPDGGGGDREIEHRGALVPDDQGAPGWSPIVRAALAPTIAAMRLTEAGLLTLALGIVVTTSSY